MKIPISNIFFNHDSWRGRWVSLRISPWSSSHLNQFYRHHTPLLTILNNHKLTATTATKKNCFFLFFCPKNLLQLAAVGTNSEVIFELFCFWILNLCMLVDLVTVEFPLVGRNWGLIGTILHIWNRILKDILKLTCFCYKIVKFEKRDGLDWLWGVWA